MTLPLRTSLAAAMMSSGRVWLRVPISSFGPHLPQFLYFSAASRRSWRVSFLAGIRSPRRTDWADRSGGQVSLTQFAFGVQLGHRSGEAQLAFLDNTGAPGDLARIAGVLLAEQNPEAFAPQLADVAGKALHDDGG